MGYIVLDFRQNFALLPENSLIDGIEVAWYLRKNANRLIEADLQGFLTHWRSYADELGGIGIFTPPLDRWLIDYSTASLVISFLDDAIDTLLACGERVPLEIVRSSVRHPQLYTHEPMAWSFVSPLGRLKTLIKQGFVGVLPASQFTLIYRGGACAIDQEQFLTSLPIAFHYLQLDKGVVGRVSYTHERQRWLEYVASSQSHQFPGHRIMDPLLDEGYYDDNAARALVSYLQKARNLVLQHDAHMFAQSLEILTIRPHAPAPSLSVPNLLQVLDSMANLLKTGVSRAMKCKNRIRL